MNWRQFSKDVMDSVNRNRGSRKTHLVKGSDLRVGDHVLVEIEVVEFDDYNHAIARSVPDNRWNVGDQRLWTWCRTGLAEPAKIEVIDK